MSVLDVAARSGVDEERAVAASLHAARLGLFDLSWNVLCPGCGSVLDANATLKTLNRSEYRCASCAAGCEPTLDEAVELPLHRQPAGAQGRGARLGRASLPECCRQVAWGSGVDLPEDLERLLFRGRSVTIRSAPRSRVENGASPHRC